MRKVVKGAYMGKVPQSVSTIDVLKSTGFAATTPTPRLAFLLHMHYEVHASVFQELSRSFAHILEIRGSGCNYVDNA